jgi:hypothetical protein
MAGMAAVSSMGSWRRGASVQGTDHRQPWLAIAGRVPGSAFVVVPERSDTDLVVGDLVHEAVLVGDAS